MTSELPGKETLKETKPPDLTNKASSRYQLDRILGTLLILLVVQCRSCRPSVLTSRLRELAQESVTHCRNTAMLLMILWSLETTSYEALLCAVERTHEHLRDCLRMVTPMLNGALLWSTLLVCCLLRNTSNVTEVITTGRTACLWDNLMRWLKSKTLLDWIFLMTTGKAKGHDRLVLLEVTCVIF